MFQTAFTLNLTQFARWFSFPERLQHSPQRNLALETLRRRNTALDALFYDIKVISPDEVLYMSASLAAEGSILIVPPSGSGALTLCETIEEFVIRGGSDVHALAVAGVGGSALGAAAFARNVADAVGGPVAVVVSGYGLADMLTEAFGTHFLFSQMKGLRPVFQLFDDIAGRPQLGAAHGEEQPSETHASLDTRTVRALLADRRLSFRFLVGHSKGNLVLSAALHDLLGEAPREAERLQAAKIVTFGARIAMPPALTDVVDVIGDWDWYGEMNSRPYITTDRRIPSAGHHTNTELPGHLPVTETLRAIVATKADIEVDKAANEAAGTAVAATEPEPVFQPTPPMRKPLRKPIAVKTSPPVMPITDVFAKTVAPEAEPKPLKPH